MTTINNHLAKRQATHATEVHLEYQVQQMGSNETEQTLPIVETNPIASTKIDAMICDMNIYIILMI